MTARNTDLKYIFKTDYVDGGIIHMAEHILLRGVGDSTVERGGVLIIFDGNVWLFEEALRDYVEDMVEVWKGEVHRLQDRRDWRCEHIGVPRYAPPLRYPIYHLYVGPTECHPSIYVARTEIEAEEAGNEIYDCIYHHYGVY